MNKFWTNFSTRLNAYNLREQWLISIMVLVVAGAILFALLLDPLLMRKKQMAAELAAQQAQLSSLQGQLQSLQASGRPDPNIPTRARLAEIQQRLVQTQAALLGLQENLVPADKMSRLLQDVLGQSRGLKLASLKTLPVGGLLDEVEPADADGSGKAASVAEKAESAPAGLTIYRHGVEISVVGKYADLVQYLVAVEKLPWRVLWGKAQMHVDAWPNATLSITLYTLSTDKTWLSI